MFVEAEGADGGGQADESGMQVVLFIYFFPLFLVLYSLYFDYFYPLICFIFKFVALNHAYTA